MGFELDRFKVQVKLALGRITNLQLKHANTSAIRRKEIAECLKSGQEERARVLVKYLIRDDYMAEVYEILQLMCDELLRSAIMIDQEKSCDESLAPVVRSIIYASTRVDIPELTKIKAQLVAKYGKEYIETANSGADPKLILKLSIRNPDQSLVSRYLAAIAESYLIPWQPVDEEALIDMDSGRTSSELLEPPPPYSPTRTGALLSPNPKQRSAPSEPAGRAASPRLGGDNGPDFDELARRFEALKSTKPK